MRQKDRLAIALLSDSEDAVSKMIRFAYYAGRESATKEVSDAYTAYIREIRDKAAKNRYKKMISEVIGRPHMTERDGEDYIYFGDYAQGVIKEFGDDEYEGREWEK